MSSNSGAPQGPWTQPNGVVASYDCHCHCGAIRWTMKLSPPIYPEQTEGKEQCVPIECHCSHCQRTGAISVHPIAKDVEFTRGLEYREEYRCAAKKNPHWNCKKCGCFIGTDLTWLMENIFQGESRYTINARMLADLRISDMKVRQDETMKKMGEKYDIGP